MADDQNTQPQDQQAPAEAKKEEAPAAEVKAEETKEEAKPSSSAKASEDKKADLSASAQKIVEQVEKLSVLELSQLVKALEEKFGVSAAPTMVAGGAAPAAADESSQQTTFNVVLADSGANKISVIKAVRELVPTLGLKEAKDLVDAPPKNVLEGVNKENAQEAKTKLEAAGAKVELK